jgi:hypothetical protein
MLLLPQTLVPAGRARSPGVFNPAVWKCDGPSPCRPGIGCVVRREIMRQTPPRREQTR